MIPIMQSGNSPPGPLANQLDGRTMRLCPDMLCEAAMSNVIAASHVYRLGRKPAGPSDGGIHLM